MVALPAWALYELARRNGRRDTIIAAVALPACVLVSIVPFSHDGAEMVSLTLRNTALCELALAVGYVMWHNREAITAESEQRLNEERLRIAREVHDVVAHAMVAINVQAGVAAHLLDQDTEQAREALLQIKRTSGDALNDLRATLGVLRDPAQAAPVGPAAGLDDLDDVAAQLRAAGVEVTVDVADDRRAHAGGRRELPDRAGVADERAPARPRDARVGRRARGRGRRVDRRRRRRDRQRRRAAAPERACAGCASGRRRSAGRSTPARARTAAGASRRGCRSSAVPA